jgi:hypothetical protein
MTMTSQDPQELSPLVAREMRAEMARQRKTVSDLAVALGLRDPKSARARYDGSKSMTISEVEVVADWLGIRRSQLLDVEVEVAS